MLLNYGVGVGVRVGVAVPPVVGVGVLVGVVVVEAGVPVAALVGVTVVAALVGVVALVGASVADGLASSVGTTSTVGVACGVTKITRSDALSSGTAEIMRCDPSQYHKPKTISAMTAPRIKITGRRLDGIFPLYQLGQGEA